MRFYMMVVEGCELEDAAVSSDYHCMVAQAATAWRGLGWTEREGRK